MFIFISRLRRYWFCREVAYFSEWRWGRGNWKLPVRHFILFHGECSFTGRKFFTFSAADENEHENEPRWSYSCDGLRLLSCGFPTNEQGLLTGWLGIHSPPPHPRRYHYMKVASDSPNLQISTFKYTPALQKLKGWLLGFQVSTFLQTCNVSIAVKHSWHFRCSKPCSVTFSPTCKVFSCKILVCLEDMLTVFDVSYQMSGSSVVTTDQPCMSVGFCTHKLCWRKRVWNNHPFGTLQGANRPPGSPLLSVNCLLRGFKHFLACNLLHHFPLWGEEDFSAKNILVRTFARHLAREWVLQWPHPLDRSQGKAWSMHLHEGMEFHAATQVRTFSAATTPLDRAKGEAHNGSPNVDSRFCTCARRRKAVVHTNHAGWLVWVRFKPLCTATSQVRIDLPSPKPHTPAPTPQDRSGQIALSWLNRPLNWLCPLEDPRPCHNNPEKILCSITRLGAPPVCWTSPLFNSFPSWSWAPDSQNYPRPLIWISCFILVLSASFWKRICLLHGS